MPQGKPNHSQSLSSVGVDLILLLLLATGFTTYFSSSPFFWDTIQLASKHAVYYYESGLYPSFLPDEINSGHIPFFGYFLAICWKLFGQSLVVSHLALLPFTWSIVILTYSLLSRLLHGRLLVFLSTLALLTEPTLLAQLSLVSPELVLIAGLFLVITGRRKASNIYITLGMILLCLISIRGIVVAGCLGVWMLWTGGRFGDLVKRSLPAMFIVVGYYLLHYLTSGWIGVHDDSPWKSSISGVSFQQWIYNGGIMAWRLLDFGRVFWILIGLVLFLKGQHSSERSQLLNLIVILFVAFFFLTTPFAGLTGHRYYLPLILISLIFVLKEIDVLRKSKKIKLCLLVCLIGVQLLSHLIVYPKEIAQGWDSSLAYVPYQSLIEELETFISEESIDCSLIGTYFPLRGNSKYRTLNDVGCTYPSARVGQDKYIITSTVMNAIEKEDYQLLSERYQILRQWHSKGIEVILYQLK